MSMRAVLHRLGRFDVHSFRRSFRFFAFMTRPSPTPQAPHPSFPRHATVDEQLTFLLGYAVLAPSGHNTQPWQFAVRDEAVWLYADPEQTLPALDPGGRERIMSCGAALFHLRVAMRHVGIEPVVERFPDRAASEAEGKGDAGERSGTSALARVSMGGEAPPTLADETLFSAIQRRRTHREAFRDEPVPASNLEALQEAAETEGAQFALLSTSAERQRLLDLVVRANETMLGDAEVRRELAAWTTGPDADAGVPGTTRGWSRWQTASAGWLQTLPGLRPDPWERETATIRSAPVLAILSTRGDTVRDWLDGGQALDRVLLRATSYGLAASFLNQPVKVPAMRERVGDLLPQEQVPQIILRMGVAQAREPQTGRRPVPMRTD
jgi:nitroreductase